MVEETAEANADVAAMSFEDAIGAYERGAALKRHCEHKLKEAKAKVDKISIGPDGAAELESADLE